jgi:hypothetical protein
LHFPLIIAAYIEGAEGVKWVLGFAYLVILGWENGISCTGSLGVGFISHKTIENGSEIPIWARQPVSH